MPECVNHAPEIICKLSVDKHKRSILLEWTVKHLERDAWIETEGGDEVATSNGEGARSDPVSRRFPARVRVAALGQRLNDMFV